MQNNNTQWTPAQAETVQRMFNLGADDAQIARAVGRTACAVAHFRASALRLTRRGWHSWSEEEAVKAHAMAKAGKSNNDIAAALNRSASSVKTKLKETSRCAPAPDTSKSCNTADIETLFALMVNVDERLLAVERYLADRRLLKPKFKRNHD